MRPPLFGRLFRRRAIERQIEKCIRDGTGLRQEQWVWPESDAIGEDDLAVMSDAIVQWCRDTMAGLRRPHGIDHVALSVACAHAGSPPMASMTLEVFRPLDFYQEGGPREQLETFIRGLDVQTLNEPRHPIRFAAALFSWGEVTWAALFADDRRRAGVPA
ncbi:MAG TPA: hypothetical protein VNL92_05060 [Dehalococcoidia bacterium]|nr:hypothetical protein [Dehalococcoidia bacterium]